MIYIYSSGPKQQLTTHDVTWSKKDRYCADQYAALEQPEELPTMPVRVTIERHPEPEPSLSLAELQQALNVYRLYTKDNFGKMELLALAEVNGRL